ncbi:MAG: DUF4907 domain-containing protein [Bacteroidales bacterium]|nr:DUF4907 domain-containing protein [Bacteroidales bacterium]
MTRKQKICCIILSIFVVCGIGVIVGIPNASPDYRLKIVKENNDTWAYIIFLENTPVIYQKYIPAIEGNVAFESKKSARMAGKLVIKKLRNNESPHIKKQEINRIYN